MIESTTIARGEVSTSADSVSKPTGADTPADALGVDPSMSTSDGDSNQSGDAECPTCNRTFDTEYGMKQHHARGHGESLIKTECECDWCGESFERHSKEIQRYDHHFCSRECKGEWQTEHTGGENNPNWGGGLTQLECGRCGSSFEVKQSHADRRQFCSRGCYAGWLSDNIRGDAHPNSKVSVELECEWCEGKFEMPPAEAVGRQFCSWACRNDWMTGESSPNYKGGSYDYYGPSWRSQRRSALKRDDHKCRICGMKNSKHREVFGQELHMHHITPFRKFGIENHQEANRLENLVTLCRDHHTEWEGIPLRPGVVD